MLEENKIEERDKLTEAKNIIDSIPFGCILIDRDGGINHVNRTAYNFLRYMENFFDEISDNLTGRSVWSLHENFDRWGRNLSKVMLENRKVLIEGEAGKLQFSIRRADFCKKIDNFLVVVESFERDEVRTHHQSPMKELSECIDVLEESHFYGEDLQKHIQSAKSRLEGLNSGAKLMNVDMKKISDNMEKLSKTADKSRVILDDMGNWVGNVHGRVSKMEKASVSMEGFIKAVSSIAQQTNLLAINATIEAARVGDSGKGFSVVAKEIKEVSKQFEQSVDDMTRTIETVRRGGFDGDGLMEKIESANKSMASCFDEIIDSVKEQKDMEKGYSRAMLEFFEKIKKVKEDVSRADNVASDAKDNIVVLKSRCKVLKNGRGP